MEISKNLRRTLASYINPDEKSEAQNEQPGGQQTAESLDGVKKARVKPSGGGLKRAHVIAGACFLCALILFCLLYGAGEEGSHIQKSAEIETQAAQPGSGNHLRNVPANYTDEAKMEQKKNTKEAAKEEKKPRVREKAVQPRPVLPRQPVRQQKPRLTRQQQEKMEEYEAMKKAYQSPIRFELKE